MKKCTLIFVLFCLLCSVSVADEIPTQPKVEICGISVELHSVSELFKDNSRKVDVIVTNDCSDPIDKVDLTIFLYKDGNVVSVSSKTIEAIPSKGKTKVEFIFYNAKTWDDFNFDFFDLQFGKWSSI